MSTQFSQKYGVTLLSLVLLILYRLYRIGFLICSISHLVYERMNFQRCDKIPWTWDRLIVRLLHGCFRFNVYGIN
jgi:hypothetical protein